MRFLLVCTERHTLLHTANHTQPTARQGGNRLQSILWFQPLKHTIQAAQSGSVTSSHVYLV